MQVILLWQLRHWNYNIVTVLRQQWQLKEKNMLKLLIALWHCYFIKTILTVCQNVLELLITLWHCHFIVTTQQSARRSSVSCSAHPCLCDYRADEHDEGETRKVDSVSCRQNSIRYSLVCKICKTFGEHCEYIGVSGQNRRTCGELWSERY
jgi:hypothetical protein